MTIIKRPFSLCDTRLHLWGALCVAASFFLTLDPAGAASPGPSAAEAEILKPRDAPAARPAAPPDKTIQMREFVDTAEKGDLSTALRVISDTGSFEIDEHNNRIYANRRTRVIYMETTLEADQLNVNLTTLEIEASGNVVLTNGEAKVTAEMLRYNFKKQTGVAHKADMRYGDMLRIEHGDDTILGPSFERVSAHETDFRNVTMTSCEFSVPHYHMKAREIILYQDDKIFLRGVTLYIRDVPVFYLPVFSKSLREGTPWFMRVGMKSRVGAWVRLGYVYKHRTDEPSLEDDEILETRSEGDLRLYADYFSKRGLGEGLTYDYNLDHGRHHGLAELYSLNDGNRDVDSEDDLDRYQALIKHSSKITDNLTARLDIDYVSDPELYDEVLDIFHEFDRQRVMERHARASLTYSRDHYIARILIEERDRIGRDRISNFSNPKDNDRDFDEQPDLLIDRRDDEGIDTNRWGTASRRLPQITASTAYLKLWNLPVYYQSELNIFNSFDSGLNTVDTDDDSYVQGFDLYNSLMWRWRISDKTALLAKVGVGGGMASRDDEYGYNFNATRQNPLMLDDRDGGLTFVDDETFLIGTEEYNLGDDVSAGYGYGDTLLRLRHQISNALTFELTHKYRATSEDSLGEWYASQGRRFVRDDIYDFRLREHNIEAALRYNLAHPRLSLTAKAYRNLIGEGELYPGENLTRYSLTGNWTSIDDTLSVSSSVRWTEARMYHESDPRSYMDGSTRWQGRVDYKPLSGLWWTRLSTTYHEQLDRGGFNDDRDRFTEQESDWNVKALLGAQIGPKWKAEVATRYNSRVGTFKRVSFNLQRDLHDAYLHLFLEFKNDVYGDKTDGGGFADQMDFRVAIQPKLPVANKIPASAGMKVLGAEKKDPAVSGGGLF